MRRFWKWFTTPQLTELQFSIWLIVISITTTVVLIYLIP